MQVPKVPSQLCYSYLVSATAQAWSRTLPRLLDMALSSHVLLQQLLLISIDSLDRSHWALIEGSQDRAETARDVAAPRVSWADAWGRQTADWTGKPSREHLPQEHELAGWCAWAAERRTIPAGNH